MATQRPQETLRNLLLLLLGTALPLLASSQTSSTGPPSASNSSSAPCQPDTQRLLLTLFLLENTTVLNPWDERGYNLSVTWQAGWNSSVWQQLGCLTDVSSLWIYTSTPLAALPDVWGAPGRFQQLQDLQIRANLSASTLPAAWARLGAFPALQYLYLYGCHLHGALPADWGRPEAFQSLAVLSLSNNSLSGELPSAWAGDGSMMQLRELYLFGNSFSTTLPASWGAGTAFQRLKVLNVISCSLTGTLPDAWSQQGSFPVLEQLYLWNNSLSGTLPASYGTQTAWQQLQNFTLNDNYLSGTLPASWASSASFPRLQHLLLGGTDLSGPLPERWGQGFSALMILDLADCALDGTLPAAWGAHGTWPSLQELYLSDNKLHGTLPEELSAAAAFPRLRALSVSGNVITGTLPAWDRGGLRQLAQLYLFNNSMTGSLPPQWGTTLPRLQLLSMSGNKLEGPLPSEWAGSAGQRAFSQLQSMIAFDNRLIGPLPSSWGSTPGAMASLSLLDIDSNEINESLPDSWGQLNSLPQLKAILASRNRLSGALPASWASHNALLSLRWLDLGYNKLAGELPAFHNKRLFLLNLANNDFAGSSSSLWNSSAPLAMVDVSSTRIMGGLPQLPAFNATLAALSVDNTSLTGMIPFTWLGPGGLLARTVFEGQALWASSTEVATWRKEVCVSPELYVNNAAARSVLVFETAALQFGRFVSGLNGSPTGLSHVLYLFENMPILADLLAGRAAQEQSLQKICRVIDARMLVAVVWGVALGVVAALVVVYCIATRTSGQVTPSVRCDCAKPLWGILRKAANLFSAVIYVVDVAKDIFVLSKVWGFHQWYGYTVLGVMLGHHVYRGFIISMYLTHSYSEFAPRSLLLKCMRWAFAVVSCPLMIIFTFYMDVCTYLAVLLGMQSPDALDVDSYADMRSLVMAIMQSLPVAICTSVIFLKGNSPFWGEYLIIWKGGVVLAGSLSSILMGLCRLLYVAYSEKKSLLRTLVMLVTGKRLHRPSRAVNGWRSCLPTCSPGCLAWCHQWSGRTQGVYECELARVDRSDEPMLVDIVVNEIEGGVSVKIMPV